MTQENPLQTIDIKQHILLIRNEKVLLDSDLASLYGVLRSKRAIQVNVEIMRTFVRFRQILSENKMLEKHLIELEKKYDQQFSVVFDAIKQFMSSMAFILKIRLVLCGKKKRTKNKMNNISGIVKSAGKIMGQEIEQKGVFNNANA